MAGRKFNANHLGTTRRYQVQETPWFEISIGGTSEDITFLTTSCTLPEPTNPKVEVPFGNSTAKVAGKREYGSGSIQIYDAMQADIEMQLLDWQKQVYDPQSGAMGWCDEYKRTMTITQYGPDGTWERTWVLEGVWPSDIDFGQMSGQQADKKTIAVTFEYDHAYREDVQPGERAQAW